MSMMRLRMWCERWKGGCERNMARRLMVPDRSSQWKRSTERWLPFHFIEPSLILFRRLSVRESPEPLDKIKISKRRMTRLLHRILCCRLSLICVLEDGREVSLCKSLVQCFCGSADSREVLLEGVEATGQLISTITREVIRRPIGNILFVRGLSWEIQRQKVAASVSWLNLLVGRRENLCWHNGCVLNSDEDVQIY